jgi:DNA-binding transcriptional MerR regulator
MSDEALLTTRKLKQRYGVTDRTISRWEDAGVLPAAARIQKRKYLLEEGLQPCCCRNN